MHSFADVASSILYGGIAIDVGHAAETKPVAVDVGVGESVDYNTCASCMERLTNTTVQLVIGNGTPVGRLLICYGSDI